MMPSYLAQEDTLALMSKKEVGGGAASSNSGAQCVDCQHASPENDPAQVEKQICDKHCPLLAARPVVGARGAWRRRVLGPARPLVRGVVAVVRVIAEGWSLAARH